MNKISYAIIIFFTFIFPLNAFATSCKEVSNFPKIGVTIQIKGNQKRLLSTSRTNFQSEEKYWEAFSKAETKAKIALMNKYIKLKSGDPEQYAKGIYVIGVCTEPGKYLQITVGREID